MNGGKNQAVTDAFIGRKIQIRSLRSSLKRGGKSKITAIYGRRRIGKTRLVQEAYGDGPRLLCFEGLEAASSAEQRRHFRNTLYRHSRIEAHRVASTREWTDLLILLAEYVGQEPCVLFFDEFQWMAAGRNELVSKLKYVWDNFLAGRRVHLVLCGSVSSFLVARWSRSRALYGRIDEVMELGPLSFPEMAAGFFGRRSVREALEYYLAFGGVPKYLELYEDRRSVQLNMAETCFSPGAFFLDELDRLFVSHFGTARHYRNIVELLAARGHATRTAVAKQIGMKSGGQVSGLLEDLCLAGFVEHYGSVHNPDSTRLRRYRICDPFLRFNFRFIEPLKQRIKQGGHGVPLHQALPDNRYSVFLGLAFEQFCYQHAGLLARKLGFSAVAHDYGSWFNRGDQATGAQVDLLFRRADRVITLCEVKFREHLGRDVVDEVERKVTAIRRVFCDHSVERVLISALPPGRALREEGYFSSIITAEDLLDDRPL